MTTMIPSAEHLHVMMNHVPLIGLAFAAIPLLFALVTRQRVVLWTGLVMVLICGASLPIVMESGETAAGGRLRHPEFRPPNAPAAMEKGNAAGWSRGESA